MDMYEEFYNSNMQPVILAEGAQSFNLDIDWGDYPYVTSSHCGIGGLLNNGFSHKHVRNVYGVVKAYDTYVGAKHSSPQETFLTASKRQDRSLERLPEESVRLTGLIGISLNVV